MSQHNDEEEFTFTWQIENFDMCPQAVGEGLNSELFVIDALQNGIFQLRIYPRGVKSEQFLTCFALRKLGKPENSTPVTSTLTLVTTDAVSQITEKGIEKSLTVGKTSHNNWEWPDFAVRQKIIDQKDIYLPNGTLTLKFRIWKSKNDMNTSQYTKCVIDQNVDPVLWKQMTAAADWNKMHGVKRNLDANKLSARTRIMVRKRSVFWSIKNITTLPRNHKLSVPVYFNVFSKPQFFLTYYLRGDSYTEPCSTIEIQKNKRHFGSDNVFVKCKIIIVNSEETHAFHSAKDKYLFEACNLNAVWKFPPFIQLIKLKQAKYLDLTNDVLYLRCEFAYSCSTNIHPLDTASIAESSYEPDRTNNNLNPHVNTLAHFYKKAKFCDATLRSGGREFPVSKIILCARSPVFCALFDTDMKEKKDGVVNIPDVEPETVDLMLDYMYTDQLGNLSIENAAKLYSAADKYEILCLKSKCTTVLTSSLSVTNVCEILELADAHHDLDLLDVVHNFIHRHSDGIFRSQRWDDWMKTNPLLATSTMLKALKNIID